MKKYLLMFYVLANNVTVFAQEIDTNLKNGFIAKGYDVVSYFNESPKKGSKSFVYNYKGSKLKFSSEENLNAFKKNPEKYFPKYGGWCAYAIAKNGKKVSINPKTYEIRNDGLYLFYNSLGTNTLDLWLNENPQELVGKADEKWEEIKLKK